MSTHDMALLLEGEAMNMDGPIPGMQGIADMDGIGDMGSAMALDEVDLFGDPVMENALVGLPARPLPSGKLLERLDELRTRGCCQGISWSRHGTVASITKDGASVEFRFIRCNPETTEWELSEPSSWSPPPPTAAPPSGPNSLASASAPFVHLAWSPAISPDLAVVDALGRLTILSFSISNNQPYPVRRWETDNVDDLHAVVGCYWLPQGTTQGKQIQIIHGPAIKHQAEYRYGHQLYPAFGPWHPNASKSAFLCVTTNGVLKLFFTQNNGRPEETALELESVTSSDDLITHASLCSDKNTLLIAIANASKQLRIIRVGIHWGLPQVDNKQMPTQSLPLRPSLRESHVAVTSWAQQGPDTSPLEASASQLSHIEILPSTHISPPQPQVQQPMAPAVILTVRSYIPQEATSYPQESQSIIDRWEVVSEQQQALHPAFEQLGSKNGATSTPPTTTRLRKLDPIILPKVIVSVSTMQYSRVLCFAFSDGTVQFRDRFTMDEMYHQPSSDTITHPLQVGFQFADNTPCLQAAFSPTNCSFTQISEDSTIKWNRLHYPMANLNGELQDDDLKTIRVALTVALSTPVGQQGSFDDVLAMARPFLQTPDFASAWVKELVNMLKIVVDYSDAGHHDQLVKNAPLQHCLSVINHLSFRGDFRPRSHNGKFALLALGIRSVFLVITVASNTPMMGVKEKLTPLDDPDVVDAVTGCTEWGLSLFAWLTNALFELVDDSELATILSDQKRFSELEKYLESKNDASLQLLLCSSTRGFLSALCRRLQHVEQVSGRAAHYYESQIQQQQQQDTATGSGGAPVRAPHPALSEAYQRMERVVASGLVKVPEFERLLAELSSDIQSAYHKTFSGIPLAKVKPQQGNMTDQQQQQLSEQFAKKAQAHCELDMVLGKNPPPCFRDILLKLFTVTLPAFRNQTDPAKLYFAKHKLLEVDDNPTILARKKAAGQYVDVFKRVEIVVRPQSKQTLSTWDEGLFPDDDLATSAKLGSIINNNSNSNDNSVKAALGGGVSEGHGMGSYRTAISGTWTGIGDANRPQWRRCVRCAAVVGDMFTSKPGYHFVLSQQRKCVCGASWGTVPRGT